MATYQSVTDADVIVVAPHVQRARDSLRAADLLRDAGLAADSVTRAQQACVHAERALLATEKRSPQDPRSVHRLAAQHFVGNDQLDRGHLTRLERLLALRERADAQPLREITADECAEAIDDARAFVDEAVRFLTAAGHRA